MHRLAVLASLVLACGDNLTPRGVGITQADDLIIVAHVSDDLLFMQPDVLDLAQRGSVTVVYLRAGARTDEGTLEAYAHAAGDDDWRCGFITIAEDDAFHCRLTAKNISLLFFDAPQHGSLVRILRETDPSTVRTLEISDTHGTDDPQHLEAGRRAIVALGATSRSADLIAYRGGNIVDEPTNKLVPVFDASVQMLARYEACATGCAECGDVCSAIEQEHIDWLLRRYAIGFRRAAGGKLRIANECLQSDLSMTACTNAPVWQLDNAGELRAGDTCLAVGPGGALTTDRCLGGGDLRWFIDDDGHIISAAGELRCLTPRDGAAQLEPCSPAGNPQWELMPEPRSTPRTTLGITATGRDVRLGDITGDHWAELCAVEVDELLCARSTGTGEFLAAMRVDSPSAPLLIEPRSLVLGDVDGDGRNDACGRNANGLMCATFASGFAAAPWSTAFADPSALPTTSASLTAIDADGDGVAEICGVDTEGVLCVSGAGGKLVRSTWPEPDAVVWFGELDADGQADWCAATETGPACAVWAQQAITTDGAPWGYAHGGVVDVTPATTATVALADIDRDNRADLCSLRDDRIVCARSQGRGFGPRNTLAILPNQLTASALWLGDLDGDGRADPCVDSGTSIVCARQP
jgi:hypothetical protein